MHSLKGKFIIEGENEKFGATFVKKFLYLLERAKGTLLLKFVDVEPLGETNAKLCAQILSRKLGRGQRVYCVEHLKTIHWENSCADQLMNCRDNPFEFTIYYRSELLNDTVRSYSIFIDTINSVANTKQFIDMINGDSLLEAKQHLKNVLAVVEAEAKLPGPKLNIVCGDCKAMQFWSYERISLLVDEPDWSNCVGCLLK